MFYVCSGYKDVPNLDASCSLRKTQADCFQGIALQNQNLTVSCIWQISGAKSLDLAAMISLRGNSLLYGGFDYSGNLCALDTKVTLDPKAKGSWSTYMHLYGKTSIPILPSLQPLPPSPF